MNFEIKSLVEVVIHDIFLKGWVTYRLSMVEKFEVWGLNLEVGCTLGHTRAHWGTLGCTLNTARGPVISQSPDGVKFQNNSPDFKWHQSQF